MYNPEVFTPAPTPIAYRTPVADALLTPYVLVEHGLEALDENVYTLGLFLEQTECRDKMFKVFQYACKAIALLIPRYFPTSSYKSIIDRLNFVDNQTGITRKYLRTFAFLPLWRMVWMVLQSHDTKWLKAGALGRLLGLSGYFFFDNIILLIKLHILDGNTSWWTRVSLSFQLVNQFSSFLVNAYQLRTVVKDSDVIRHQLAAFHDSGMSFEEKQSLREQLKVLATKYSDLEFQIIKNMSEGTLAANFVFGMHLPEIFVVGLDLTNAYLSMREVFLRLRAKARAEKGEKEKQAKKVGMIRARSMSFEQRNSSS